MSFLDDDEGIGVDLHNQFFQLRQLLLFHGSQDYFCVLMGIAAFSVEEGGTPIQFFTDLLCDGFLFLGND